MQLARELARRSAALRFEDLPADAVHWAKIGILDTVGVTLAGCGEDCARIARKLAGNGVTVGVTLAGCGEDCARIARKLAGNGGSSLVFGTSERANMLDAALVNGVAAHALDFDDMNNTLGGH